MNFLNTVSKLMMLTTTLLLVACGASKITTSTDTSIKQFEGKMIYDFVYEDKTGEMSKDQIQMLIGDEQIYTIKGANYKSEMNGMMKSTQYYLGGDTLFNHFEGMNTLLWIDATTNDDEVIDFNIKENAETINDIKCDLLTINSKEGTTKYYFNKKYSADPAYYPNHEYGFWKFCIEKTNAFPLKIIVDTKEEYVEMIVTEIKKIKIDEAEFDMPNLPRVESPER